MAAQVRDESATIQILSGFPLMLGWATNHSGMSETVRTGRLFVLAYQPFPSGPSTLRYTNNRTVQKTGRANP